MMGPGKLKGQREYDNGKRARRKSRSHLTKLLVGLILIGLTVGVGYAILFISSLYSITRDLSDPQVTSQNEVYDIPSHERARQVESLPVPNPPPESPPAAKIVERGNLKKNGKENPISAEAAKHLDSSKVLEDYPAQSPEERRAQEIRELRAALPRNMMIPDEITAMQIDTLIEAAEEQQALKELIDSNTATLPDRERYFELLNRQFEDEKELINYCKQIIEDYQDEPGSPYGLCGDITRQGVERLKEIDNSIADLRKKLML